MEKSANNPSHASEKTTVTENPAEEPVISIEEQVTRVDKTYGTDNEGSMALNELVNGEFNSSDEDDVDYIPAEKEIQNAIKAAEEMRKQYNIISDELNKSYDKGHSMDTHSSDLKPRKRTRRVITDVEVTTSSEIKGRKMDTHNSHPKQRKQTNPTTSEDSSSSDVDPDTKKRKISAKNKPSPRKITAKSPRRRTTRRNKQSMRNRKL